MHRSLTRLPALLVAGLLPLAATAAPTPAPTPTTSPASRRPDYYQMSAAEFFRRPEVQQRFTSNFVNVPLLEAAIFHESNRQRADLKLPLFKHSWALQLMARRHSLEMVDLQYFDHVSPTPANRTLADRLKAVGLSKVGASENIVVQPALEMGSGVHRTTIYPNGQQIMRDAETGKVIHYNTYEELAKSFLTTWMNSPPHRENMVNPRYLYLGTGIARGPYTETKQDSIYATQNFSTAITARPGDAEARAREQPEAPPATRPQLH
jgi:uncharacterized protein YkwD